MTTARVTITCGKPQYSQIIEFAGGRGMRDAFSAAVTRAVLEVDPHALDVEERAT
jgi:hypothetical protein